MTIKDTIRKYTKELKLVTHIPAKEVEILMMYLLDKNTIWLHINNNKEFEQEKELVKLVKKRADIISSSSLVLLLNTDLTAI